MNSQNPSPLSSQTAHAARSLIAKGQDVVTLINVFTVDPDRQAELLALLREATEDTMRHLPGFVSANLHRSLDGKHVANYAQWRSREALQAMLENPRAQVHMQAARKIATVEPVLYEVDSVHDAAQKER